MSTPAGWFTDPYARFAQRYWDGTEWTEHVADTEGTQQVDPLGRSTVRPFFPQEPAVGTADPGHGEVEPGDDQANEMRSRRDSPPPASR